MFENVVVGATDSDGATRAVRRAIEVTQASGGTLHIVSALGSSRSAQPLQPAELRDTGAGASETDILLGQLRAMADRAQVKVATHPVLAEPAEAITRVAAQEHADLIVVGSKADHGTRHLSSVPKAVMDRAACAVMVV
jgi:nucleotide-binding universal stress UspA family protein